MMSLESQLRDVASDFGLVGLKLWAERMEAPISETEMMLVEMVARESLDSESRPALIATAKQLGIVRRLTTKQDAIDAIVRWVLAGPLAKQLIAY